MGKVIITETIGVDLGDRFSTWCVVNERTGAEVEQGKTATTPDAMGEFFARWPRGRVVLEVGTHSPWVSRLAGERCAEVQVANPRQLRFIYGSHRKSDTVDPKALARVGRMDVTLLSPVHHRGEEAQRDLAEIRARHGLVGTRTALVNSARGLLKSFGHRLPKQDAKSVGLRTLQAVPEDYREFLRPLLLAIEGISDEVHTYDKRIEYLAEERYPETHCLRQVVGIGALTSLAYVLTVESPDRFPVTRHVAAFLGLVPRRDQSGDVDKQLGITKAGDSLVRTLLVQAAQYILGPFGPDTALRRFGLHLAARGGKAAKTRAVVAVARKLSVLLLHLWRTGEEYEPLRHARAE